MLIYVFRRLPGRELNTKPPEYEDGDIPAATFDEVFFFYIITIISRFFRWQCVSITFVSPSHFCT